MTPLTLYTQSCSCQCGNTWQHSYVTHAFGGTISLPEQLKGIIRQIHPSNRHYGHCFACAKITDPAEQLLSDYLTMTPNDTQ